jgi:hypothetical protein
MFLCSGTIHKVDTHLHLRNGLIQWLNTMKISRCVRDDFEWKAFSCNIMANTISFVLERFKVMISSPDGGQYTFEETRMQSRKQRVLRLAIEILITHV